MFEDSSSLLILALVAGAVLFKLYSVLGQQKEGEVYPYKGAKGNGATLNMGAEEEIDDNDDVPGSKKLTKLISEMKKLNRSFNLRQFIKGANSAFEIILEAFTGGDKDALKALLSKEVYSKFEKDIDSRKRKGKFPSRTLVAIVSSNLVSGALEKNIAKLSVEFVSEQVSLVKNKDGKVVEGDPSHVEKVKDIWTFTKNIKSSTPIWLLETTSG